MIRAFASQDIDDIMAIWLQANQDAHDFVDKAYWSRNFDMVKALLPNAELYVYDEQGIKGFIGVVDDGYVAGLFVRKDARSQGIGKQLLDVVKEKYGRLLLDVYEKNSDAIRFYFQQDFEPIYKERDDNTGEVELQMVWQKEKTLPEAFSKGTGNIWTEPYLAQQMLKAHLNELSDGASRQSTHIQQTVAFIDQHIKPGSHILDLGCGPGLYAEALCQRGHHVTGVDFSENTIAYARSHAERCGLAISYRCQDFHTLAETKQYDVVLQIYGELNTMHPVEQQHFLKVVYEALKEGGVFIGEVSTPAHRKKARVTKHGYVEDGGFWRPGRHIVLEDGLDYGNNLWLDQYRIIDEGGIASYHNWFQDETARSLQDKLLQAGFKGINILHGLTGEDVRDEAEWLTFFAYR